MADAIMVEHAPAQAKLSQMRVSSWPIWEKEPSTFDWHYDEQETCYLLEGEVRVQTRDGTAVELRAGDLVTFAKGLDCTWTITKHVRKHYQFG